MRHASPHSVVADQIAFQQPWCSPTLLTYSRSSLLTIVPFQRALKFQSLDQGAAPPGRRVVQLALAKLGIAQPSQHALDRRRQRRWRRRHFSEALDRFGWRIERA